MFKKSTIFKRYYFKRTKFNRKSLAKVKQKHNWILYSQILKYWIKTFLFCKIIFKFQYKHKILQNTFFSYDFDFIRTRIYKNLEHNTFSNFITKKILILFFFNKTKKNINNLFLSFTYLTNFFINTNINAKQLYFLDNNVYYLITKKETFQLLSYKNLWKIYEKFFFSLFMQKIKLFYQIIYFWVYITL